MQGGDVRSTGAPPLGPIMPCAIRPPNASLVKNGSVSAYFSSLIETVFRCIVWSLSVFCENPDREGEGGSCYSWYGL